jgi:hypothetical protein
VFRSGREHFDDFVRVDESALAHADDFLVVFGQRFDGLQFVRGPEGDEHPAAARARNAHHHVAQFAGRRMGMRARTTTCSNPRPSVAGASLRTRSRNSSR